MTFRKELLFVAIISRFKVLGLRDLYSDFIQGLLRLHFIVHAPNVKAIEPNQISIKTFIYSSDKSFSSGNLKHTYHILFIGKEKKTTSSFVTSWCSTNQYSTTSFNNVRTQILRWFKACLRRVGDS